jgi:S1-C subfamily serine protease
MKLIFSYLAFLIWLPAHLTPAMATMLPKVITTVRSACVEVLVDRQLKGGGAIVECGQGRAYVITAAHLFPLPNSYITIMTERHGNHLANLIAYDFGHDLALLEIVTNQELPVIPIASYTPSPTQPVFNFGPALKRQTLIISGDMADSRLNYTDFEPSEGYIEHIFINAINPVLTSGGIWVNQEGEIIGVQSGRLKGDPGAPSSGLSMACPPGAIRHLLKTKITTSTPCIGGWVWELWTIDYYEILKQIPENIQGLAVRWVRPGGAMDRAGIKANDVILSCDNQPILRRNDLFSLIREQPSGATFSLKIYTPSTQKQRTVKLKTIPLETRWNNHLLKIRGG